MFVLEKTTQMSLQNKLSNLWLTMTVNVISATWNVELMQRWIRI